MSSDINYHMGSSTRLC